MGFSVAKWVLWKEEEICLEQYMKIIYSHT